MSRHEVYLLLDAGHFLRKALAETLYAIGVNFYSVMLHTCQNFGKRQLYLVQKPCHSLLFNLRKHYGRKACQRGDLGKFPQFLIGRNAVLRAHSLNRIFCRICVKNVPQNIRVCNNVFQRSAVFNAKTVHRLCRRRDFFAFRRKKIKLQVPVGNSVNLFSVCGKKLHYSVFEKKNSFVYFGNISQKFPCIHIFPFFRSGSFRSV